MSRKKDWRYYLFQPYKWLVFGPVLALSMIIGALIVLLVGRWFPRFCNRGVAAGWCVLNTYTSLSKINTLGAELIDKQQSYIIVANHLSHFDIFLLYGWLGLDIRWVMKQELRKIPLFGSACEALGHIYIDRGNHEVAQAQLSAARESFVPGTSIVFFPEGTRNTSGELKSFKSGAFIMAKQMQLPILPIALVGTDEIAPARTLDLFPGTAEVRILPPIAVEEVMELSSNQLKERARDAIAAAL